MNILIFSLILVGVMLNAIAQIMLKVGMQKIGHFELTWQNAWPIGLQAATSLPILGGIICCIASITVWLIVLSRAEISLAYPMVSMGYIVTALAAYFWLGEQLGPMRLAGIIVIMVGVWMVAQTA